MLFKTWKSRAAVFAVTATLAVPVLGVASPAGAAKGGNTTVFQSQLKGVGADALLESIDTTGCLVTDAFVQAVQVAQTKNTGLPSGASAAVDVSKYDQCTGTFLSEAAGQSSLPSGAFQIDSSKLSAASLVASVVVTDFATSNTFTVDMNVAWIATGAASTTKAHVQQKFPGFTITENFKGASRNASANGAVSQGGTTLVSGDALFADLFNQYDRTVQITRS